MTEQHLNDLYNPDFFDHLRDGSRQSAAVIVPLLLDWLNAQSVVDVGCGDGTWLSIFQAHGVEDILGLDGSYVTLETLQIPARCFRLLDLSQPISLGRTFDLAVSLEVAEHLPEKSAKGFVESLVQLSDVVLFSAAIPHQGGTNHINEQWPEYWIALFEDAGYVAIDALRARIWTHSEVQPWYAQNSFLFVRRDYLPHYPDLQNQLNQSRETQRSIVHPTFYLQKCPELLSNPQPDSNELILTPKIEILAATLNPSAEIQCGEGVTIHIQYQLVSPVESAIFNVTLSNEAGHTYLEAETVVTTLPTDLAVTQVLQLNIERLDLAQGIYFINPGVFSLDWKQTYDFHWHRYPLTIQSPLSKKGLLHPPMHWKISI